MDLLDRLLGHDAWTTRELLLRCRELRDDEFDQVFDIGHRTVRATFEHLIRNMEIWTDLMAGVPVRPSPSEAGRSVDGLRDRLDVIARDLAAVATRIRRDNRWDDRWVDPLDRPPTEKSYGGAIAHILTHSMHHRAQLLYLLRRVGVQNLPEGDALSWEMQLRETR
jgi:uncharacterized damage-inducible protein DinB